MATINEILNRPEVKVLSTENLGEGVQRQFISINGFKFKRITKTYYPVVWCDMDCTLGEAEIVNKENTEKLESVYQLFAKDQITVINQKP